MRYLDIDLNLSKEDIAIQREAHEFAKGVMRPAAEELGRLTPEKQIADDSPLWDFLKQAYQLGYHAVIFPEEVGGMGLTPLQQAIVMEEMGWGSNGLCIQLGAAGAHALGGLMSMNPELLEEFTIPFCNCKDGSIRGCWAVTEPDHGSDTLGFGESFFDSPEIRPNCRAILDGNEWVISGQKSAWVSGAPVANHCLVHLQIDPDRGFAGIGAAIVPLDIPGCSKGKPHEMLGMRELNQCELYFDDVRIPAHYMFMDNADYYFPFGKQILAGFNMTVACFATGLARAAFEEAFSYCHERVQGGKLLKEHYSVKRRIFEMFSRVETCRALSRRAVELNGSIFPGFPEYSIAAKTVATELAFQNAHDAITILGANGLSTEYHTEKLFRDARENLIADGTTETLQKVGGHFLFETYPRTRESINRMG
ncbi:Acyl-CoA dehydrogenase [Olavius sp. associated proteobacterium Delta 1]|nr:Acyl-CoA dehydrogenase [Olavius sp. associated proteobacterium Delta 1]